MDWEESRPGFSVSTEKVAWVSKRKLTDWSPTVTYNWGSSGVIRMGACVGAPGHLQPQLSWESDPWGLCLGGQSLFQYGPFSDWTWNQGWLRCLRAILLEIPLPTIMTSPSLFTWVLLGLFLRLFQSRSNRHCGGFSLLPGSYYYYYFLPPTFLLVFSNIIYHLNQL